MAQAGKIFSHPAGTSRLLFRCIGNPPVAPPCNGARLPPAPWVFCPGLKRPGHFFGPSAPGCFTATRPPRRISKGDSKVAPLPETEGLMPVLDDNLLLSIAAYVLAINTLEFLAFAWDKHCARKGMWRISESTLLLLALIGGSVGAIAGQRVLRHKTRKEPFRTNLLVIAGLQVIALVALAFPDVRNALWNFLGV